MRSGLAGNTFKTLCICSWEKKASEETQDARPHVSIPKFDCLAAIRQPGRAAVRANGNFALVRVSIVRPLGFYFFFFSFYQCGG